MSHRHISSPQYCKSHIPYNIDLSLASSENEDQVSERSQCLLYGIRYECTRNCEYVQNAKLKIMRDFEKLSHTNEIFTESCKSYICTNDVITHTKDF